jgi:hypothetical protein
MKYRIVWTHDPKTVVSVVVDSAGTITNYNEVNHSHAVVEDLEEFKGGLVLGGYDVGVITAFQEQE